MRNVFFIRAHDAESLDRAFLEIAMSIGHDILECRHSGADLHAIWIQLGPIERIDAFRRWLGETQNESSLFIVDDIDGIGDDSAIRDALPRDARFILFSTRDPSIVDSVDRACEEIRVPSMDVDEMASLMAFLLKRSKALQIDITEHELESIARVVDGHALGACRAISYIVRVLAQTAKDRPVQAFLKMMVSSNWKARLHFLQYEPSYGLGLSIEKTFEVSLQRLRKHQDEAISLLELIANLSGTEDTLDFRQFLDIERLWLEDVKTRLPDYATFANGLSDKSEVLAELENVSIGFRPSLSQPLRLHPLWTECMLQRAGHERRCSWLSQILLLSYESSVRGEFIDTLDAFVQNCGEIAERFDIELEQLTQSKDMNIWLRSILDYHDGSDSSEEVESTSGTVSTFADPPRPSFHPLKSSVITI